MTYSYNPESRPIIDDWLTPEEGDEAAALKHQTRLLIEQLEAERNNLRQVVEAVEWAAEPLDGDRPETCPWCERLRDNGHDPDCQLAAALCDTPQEQAACSAASEPEPVEYCWSTDQEFFKGKHPTREAALREALDYDDDLKRVWTARAVKPSIASGHAENIVEQMALSLSDQCGEAGEDGLLVNQADIDALEAVLAPIFDQWLEGRIRCWSVADVEEHDVPAALSRLDDRAAGGGA